jgi:hypothetical protein
MLACSLPFAFKAARVCSAFFGTPVLVHVSVSALRNPLSLTPVSMLSRARVRSLSGYSPGVVSSSSIVAVMLSEPPASC